MGVVAFIGLGANLGNPRRALADALARLGALPGTRLAGVSALYATRPVGPPDQPDYVNAAAKIETDLEPTALLVALKAIEESMGRVPTVRWGPRLIDLDILLYGDVVLVTPNLEIPHRELTRRRFALQPLADLAPNRVVPGSGATVQVLLARLPEDGIRRLGDQDTAA